MTEWSQVPSVARPLPEPEPQPVIAPLTDAAIFLVLTIQAGKPANSHVALNTIEDPDGTGRQILRANMPFGELGRGEFGTYYAGYAATPSVTEQMLVNMFVGNPPGNYDRILDFSTAVTGCLFFAPSADFLDDLPDPPGRAPASPDTSSSPDDNSSPAAGSWPGAGSLGIGSLKRST